jgi:hypothetical protein
VFGCVGSRWVGSPRSGGVEEEACGGRGGLLEPEMLALSELDRAHRHAVKELVQGLDRKVIPSTPVSIPRQHGADRRVELLVDAIASSTAAQRRKQSSGRYALSARKGRAWQALSDMPMAVAQPVSREPPVCLTRRQNPERPSAKPRGGDA